VSAHLWHRLVIAGGVIILTGLLAKLVDSRISHEQMSASQVTRYRVVRRTVFVAIVFVGVLSALLVIPQVRAVAGGILASSAVVGLIIGFAAQRTLGNFIAGILIAFTQPIRIGDDIEIADAAGVVEEIGLTYTWLRTPEDERIAIPNDKLASETIHNKTYKR